MGYYSRVQGSIEVFPGISISEALSNTAIAKFLKHSDHDSSIQLVESSGDFLDTIECPFEDEFKAYWLERELKELVQALGDRTYSGYLEIQGEGDGIGDIDLWRLYVKDGKVEEVKPKLVWPEM